MYNNKKSQSTGLLKVILGTAAFWGLFTLLSKASLFSAFTLFSSPMVWVLIILILILFLVK
jgi:hypothetical protein